VETAIDDDMSTTLTLDHIHAIMDPIDQGDWSKLYEAIDENVRWWIGADEHNPDVATGVYVRCSALSSHRRARLLADLH
jgi:hypothetical protein